MRASGVAPTAVQRWARGLAGDPATVLAALAAALGLPWSVPTRAGCPAPETAGPVAHRTAPGDGGPPKTAVDLGAMPAAPAWELLDAAREALLARGERRRLGAHHTPPDLARQLVAIALESVPEGATVVDPACGGGAFLVAAALARPDVRLVGIDLDPLALATTAAALAALGRHPTLAAHRRTDAGSTPVDAGCRRSASVEIDTDGGSDVLVVGDGLEVGWAGDVVVGNPPFLSPLGADTVGTPAAVAARAELGAPYLDTAALFLLRAAERADRVVLLQPESVLTSRDARAVRERVHGRLEGLWVAGEPVFPASIRVCAPMLGPTGATGASSVRRWRGSGVRTAGRAPRPAPGARTWAMLRPTTAPTVRISRAAGRVGDLATATAGFRDEFYAIAAAATDGGAGAPVVTSGLVDPGRLAWGERPARIGGRSFAAPTVEPGDLVGRTAAWGRARLVPKVLVATQTRVVEAAPDPEGRALPLTPVLAVTPHDPADVWRLAAALTSPIVTAWALRTYGGAAMGGDAVKLSAAQVLEAPLPTDEATWAEATAHLRAGSVVACGTALAAGDERLVAWWRRRLPTVAVPSA